jgi:putative ABC transport system substrate-binding protein
MKQRYLLSLFILLASLLLSACLVQGEPVTALPSGQAEILQTTDEHATTPQEGLEWFQPSSFISQHWDLSLDSTQAWLYLTPKQTGDQTYKILFVYSSVTPAFDRAVSKVLSVFSGRNLIVEALVVLAAQTDPTEQQAAMQSALDYAEQNQFDLVYAVSSKSTAALFSMYNGGKLPVVSLLSKDPVALKQIAAYDQGSGTNFAFTSVNVPVDVQMVYLLQAMPTMSNIVMVYEATNTSTVDTQVTPLKNYITAQSLPIRVWDATVQDPENASAEMNSLVPAVLAQALANDPQGNSTILLVPASRSIQAEFDTLVELAGNTPIFSLYPEIVRSGLSSAVLAIGVSFDSNSLLAGNYGVRILQDGEKPGEMVVGLIRPPDIAVNFAKARQVGLSIPFSFFESATLVFGPDGQVVR